MWTTPVLLCPGWDWCCSSKDVARFLACALSGRVLAPFGVVKEVYCQQGTANLSSGQAQPQLVTFQPLDCYCLVVEVDLCKCAKVLVSFKRHTPVKAGLCLISETQLPISLLNSCGCDGAGHLEPLGTSSRGSFAGSQGCWHGSDH